MAEISTHAVTCSRCARALTLTSIEGSPQFFALAESSGFYALAGTGDNTEVFFVCSVECAELVQADPVAYMKPPERCESIALHGQLRVQCERVAGHEGDHVNDRLRWPPMVVSS